jgi:ribosomal protein S18 acetylase RimI-like enzyme
MKEHKSMNMKNIVFQKIENNYPYNLLLQADETQEGIDKYLFDSEVYVAKLPDSDKPVGVCCLLRVDADTVELMNIAIDEPYRGMGIGGVLIGNAIEIAVKKGYSEIILGTADCATAQIRFYERHGFQKSNIRKNYFIEKYPDNPIYEDGVQLIDMVVLKKPLK